MAIIRDFKCIRPTPELAEKIAALPYDVYSSNEARELVKDNPYSFLHVDKAEIDLDPSTNIYDRSVYEKAAENFQNMLANSWLIEDSHRNLYIYELTMDGRCQTGIVCLTSVDEYLSGKIKKHEFTRVDKENDRVNHIKHVGAHTGPIFLVYNSVNEIKQIVNNWKSKFDPVYDITFEDKTINRVWIIDDSQTINNIVELFGNVPNLYIADGHHRNAAAVRVGQEMRQNGHKGAEEFNYYLSIVFPHDELNIMDYNRVVRDINNLTTDEFLKKLGDLFIIEEKTSQYKPEQIHTFGMYIDNTWYKLTAKKHIVNDMDCLECLDVSILQKYVIEQILNITDVRTDYRIDFIGGIRGLSEIEKRVSSGEMKVGFSMYPTSIKQLLDVASDDKIMPPKSTWFEPKLRSGIFIHKI